MHVEQASRRREAVAISSGRRGAKGVVQEVKPDHGSRFVDVEVIGGDWRDKVAIVIIQVSKRVMVSSNDKGELPPYVLSQWHAATVRHFRLAVVNALHLTTVYIATKEVDPAVDRRKSVVRPAGRLGAGEKGVGTAPGRQLRLGT